MDKDAAIQLLTNLQHDYQSYADAFGAAIQSLQGVITIVDAEKDATIADLDATIAAQNDIILNKDSQIVTLKNPQ